MRLIDADALREDIETINYADWNNYSDTIDLIDDAPTIEAEPVRQWVPCSERMPDDWQRVLIFTDTQELYVVTYDRRFDTFSKRFYPVVYEWLGEEVTHWMPLPEPPKGGADNVR